MRSLAITLLLSLPAIAQAPIGTCYGNANLCGTFLAQIQQYGNPTPGGFIETRGPQVGGVVWAAYAGGAAATPIPWTLQPSAGFFLLDPTSLLGFVPMAPVVGTNPFSGLPIVVGHTHTVTIPPNPSLVGFELHAQIVQWYVPFFGGPPTWNLSQAHFAVVQ